MKKILLSLVLGIFLLSLVSASIAITLNGNRYFNTTVYRCTDPVCSSLESLYYNTSFGNLTNSYSVYCLSETQYLAEYDYITNRCYVPHSYITEIPCDSSCESKEWPINFTKKQCTTPINSYNYTSILYDNETQNILVNVSSPLTNPEDGPALIPSYLEYFYSGNVKTIVEIKNSSGNLVYNSTQNQDILSSKTKNFNFENISLSAGVYNLTIKSYSDECFCSSNITSEIKTSFIVNSQPDITCYTNSSWTDFYSITSCRVNDTILQERNLTSSDSCGCSEDITYYDYQEIACDYCTPSLTNSSWTEFINLTACQANNTILQQQSLTEYDSNFCGEVANVTYYNYSEIHCDYCTPSLTNTTKTDWENVSCSSGQMNQSRSWVEYDENYCEEFENVTHYEYQLVGDSSCSSYEDITPPIITINSPENTAYVNSTTSVVVNFTINEEGYCWFGDGVGNFTMDTTDNLNFNSTYPVTSGNSYTLYAYCNDTEGNNNSTSVTFNVNDKDEDDDDEDDDDEDNGNGGGGCSSCRDTKETIEEARCGNDICEYWLGEDEYNCEKDCFENKNLFYSEEITPLGGKKAKVSIGINWILIILILLLILLLVLIFVLKRK